MLSSNSDIDLVSGFQIAKSYMIDPYLVDRVINALEIKATLRLDGVRYFNFAAYSKIVDELERRGIIDYDRIDAEEKRKAARHAEMSKTHDNVDGVWYPKGSPNNPRNMKPAE